MTDVQSPAKAGVVLTLEECVERAEAFAQFAAPYAAQCEQERRVPMPVIDKFMETGLMPLVRPARYGGYQMGWSAFLDVLTPIGRHSGSITWCIGFLMQHQWVLAMFPEATQDKVYARHPDPKVVTSFAPSGTGEKVDGGWKVTGEWSFGSGGDHCEWAVVGVMIPVGDHMVPHWCLFEPGQFWIRDVWHSIGLRGTGSNNIVIEGAGDPRGHAVSMPDLMSGNAPNKFLNHPLFTSPPSVQFQHGLLSPMLAIARGLMTSFLEFNKDRVAGMGGGKAAENPLLQARIGEAASELTAAATILASLDARLMAGQMHPGMAGEFSRGIAMVAKMIVAASERLFGASGARGLSEAHVFGRNWRDVHAISNHGALQYEGMFQNIGRSELGLPPLGRR